MSEVIYSNPQEVSGFLERAGIRIKPEQVIEVYPGTYSDRRVLRIVNRGRETSRVLKVRPWDDDAKREAKNLPNLLSSYRFSGTHFGGLKIDRPRGSGFVVMNMPYLGVDIIDLANSMQLQKYGYNEPGDTSFSGFTSDQITKLINGLKASQGNFTQFYNLIHGDVFQVRTPNNIVYNDQLDKLLLVDAEALVLFDEGMSYVEEWMCDNMLR